MHDIVIHLPNSPNKDAEDLDNGENPGNNNGILIHPVFLYVKNQLHWRMEAWLASKKTLFVALGRRW